MRTAVSIEPKRCHSVVSLAAMVASALATLTPVSTLANDEMAAMAAVFTTRCAACHTVGEGDAVGPDLAGVTERRDRGWLISFIRSSQSVILSGDALALELFARFGGQRMPDHPLAEDEIDCLLSFIEAGGPALLQPTVRSASDATAAEVRVGRDLFFGPRDAESGGTFCAACHSLARDREPLASFGGSLSGAARRYSDLELARLLEQPSAWSSVLAYPHEPLTADESLGIRAFLSSVGDRPIEARTTLAHAFPFVGLGLGGVLLTGGVASRRRRSRSTAERRES